MAAASAPLSGYDEEMLMDILESTLESPPITIQHLMDKLAEKYGKDDNYFKSKTVAAYRSRFTVHAQMLWKYHSTNSWAELDAQWKRDFASFNFTTQQRQRILEIGSKLPLAPEEKTVHSVLDSSESDSDIQERDGDLAFMQTLLRGGAAATAAAAPKPKAAKLDYVSGESEEGVGTEEDETHREYKGRSNRPPPPPAATLVSSKPTTTSFSSSLLVLTLLADLDKKADRALTRLERIEHDVASLTNRVEAESIKSANFK